MLYSFYFRSSNMYSDSFFSLFIRQKYPSKLGNLCYTNKQFTHCGSTLLCSNSSNLFIVRWILLFWSTEQFQAKNHSYFSISYHHYLRSFNNKSFERKNSVLILIQFLVSVPQQAHTIWWSCHSMFFASREWGLKTCFVWMFRCVKNTIVNVLVFLEFLNFAYEIPKSCFIV